MLLRRQPLLDYLQLETSPSTKRRVSPPTMGLVKSWEPFLLPPSGPFVTSGGPEPAVSGGTVDVDEGSDVAVDSGLSRTSFGMSSIDRESVIHT